MHKTDLHKKWQPYSPPCSEYKEILNIPLKSEGLISRTYLIIISTAETTIPKIKDVKELFLNIPDLLWSQAWVRVTNSSSYASLSLSQFKAVNHLNQSESKLLKMYPNLMDIWNRCYNSRSYTHFGPSDKLLIKWLMQLINWIKNHLYFAWLWFPCEN